jgi:hypothetical protein
MSDALALSDFVRSLSISLDFGGIHPSGRIVICAWVEAMRGEAADGRGEEVKRLMRMINLSASGVGR